MYDGDRAIITMIQNFKEDEEKDTTIYDCTVIEYQKEKEQIHLLMNEGQLKEISLDAIYECRVQTLKGEDVCNGVVNERYISRAGKVLELQIQNGFYEINIK